MHIEKNASSSFKLLGFVYRMTKTFNDSYVLMSLYKSMVRSKLDYCSSIWCPSQQFLIKKLDSLDLEKERNSNHLTLYGGYIFPVQHSLWHFLPSAIYQLQLSKVFKIKAQLRPSKSRQFFFLPLNFGGLVGGLSRHFFGAPKFQGFLCVCVGVSFLPHQRASVGATPPLPPPPPR